jgi:peptidoglycan/LPS O-acetylase OafA/YrhL
VLGRSGSPKCSGFIPNDPSRADMMQVRGHRFVHLDMLRGLAALGVVVGHTRGFFIINYGAAGSYSLFDQLFYFATGLGHQCVIAFFALSGFLVGGPALRNIIADRWNWRPYLVRRLTRLWTVLIPALLLTWVLDTAGGILGGQGGYDGAFYSIVSSGPDPAHPADLSLPTFLANVFFMQTIMAPVFGSNGPLWSLANEFWYYVTAPLLLYGIIGGGVLLSRACNVLIGIAVVTLLPIELISLGSIWLAGTVAHYIVEQQKFHRMIGHPVWAVSILMSVIIFLMLDKLRVGLLCDLLLGAAFAAILPILSLLPDFGNVYGKAAKALSNISYTVYATHFPVLAFLWFVLFAPNRWPVGVSAMVLLAGAGGTALIIGTAMWWAFERNTDYVRKAVEQWAVSVRNSGDQKGLSRY